MKTILVVDDEPEVVELVRNRLEANGYHVISASDGVEGVKKAQKQKPDLIIMDILMPNLQGGDAVKILRTDAATKSIPVIFLTVVIDHMSAGNEIGSVNIDGHFFVAIAKPFKPEQLLIEIEKLVGD